MYKEAIILAGGFGTRLSHVLGYIPKPMAPTNGKPFLCYLLDRLAASGIEHVILATGYMHESIEGYFGERYAGMRISYSQEKEALFTGGAIRQAAEKIAGDSFFVLNGDTFFDIDLLAFGEFHSLGDKPISIALQYVDDTSRYGAVETDGDIIRRFHEKDPNGGKGYINGGIYAVNTEWLLQQDLPRKFSFEKEMLVPLSSKGRLRGKVFSRYFIDIGIPSDYYRAQKEFATLFEADKYLFLDRDGVLNERIEGDYVRNAGMWKWMDGAREALGRAAKRYARIFIVSNQQGVGKGLFTDEDLANVHQHMLRDIAESGGRIDKIYICTDLASNNSPNRKPETGMAMQAKHDFPEVDFRQSIMVGDSESDMAFGYRCGMRCVYLSNGKDIPTKVRDYTDLVYNDISSL